MHRLPDYIGCGCCHEFDGPEEGVVAFREPVLNERWSHYKEEFKKIKERNHTWKVPRVRSVDLLRSGEVI